MVERIVIPSDPAKGSFVILPLRVLPACMMTMTSREPLKSKGWKSVTPVEVRV